MGIARLGILVNDNIIRVGEVAVSDRETGHSSSNMTSKSSPI